GVRGLSGFYLALRPPLLVVWGAPGVGGRPDPEALAPRLAALAPPPAAGGGPAGAAPAHQDVDVPARRPPDLLGGGLAVNLRIGRVLELLRDECLGLPAEFGVQFVRPGHGPLHPEFPRREIQLRPECLQEPLAFERHALGHGDGELVPAGRTSAGQPDPGVAPA